MAYNPQGVKLLRDEDGLPIPQFYDAATGKMKPLEDPRNVQLTGSNLQQQLTEADAVTGTLTFDENISYIEIYNRDETNDGTFNVNGIDILVPKSTPQRISVFENPVGGTPRATVNVSGSTSYIVSRYS